MFNRSYRKYNHMSPEMVTKYLPRYRRDLQEYMVADSQANFFVICVQLKLFKAGSIDQRAMNDFSRKLYKLVKRRHTHLWDKHGRTNADERNAVETSSAQAGQVS